MTSADLNRQPLSEVMPPFEIERDAGNSRIREDLEMLVKKLGKFVAIPGIPANSEITKVFHKAGFEVLSISEKFKFDTPYFVTGSLTSAEKNFVFKSSRAIFIAGQELSLAELKNMQEISQTLEKPILATPAQNEILPGLCWHNKSGWVLDQGLGSLEQVLRQHPELSISGQFQSLNQGENLDSTLNELLRMYSKALQQRQT